MLFLYRFFCGILEVEFFGTYPEKVLNLAAKHGITIWSARYINQKIRCKITVKDFLKLPDILRKSGIRVHIIEKTGFPFFIKRYNKRLGIFSGLIVFFLTLYVMSSFVWVIDIEGNKAVSDGEILSVCEDLGIRQGVRKRGIKAKAMAQELLLEMDNLAWGSLNLEGCKLTVNVTEIVKKIEDNTVATNLIASCDGIVTHIDVQAGNCLVKVGDIVAKGDVLVSGIIENEAGTRFVHSIGEIEAITETQVELKQDFIHKITTPTGKYKNKRVLEFFGLKIPLYLGGVTGEYKAEKKERQLEFLGQKIPVKIYTKKFIFTKTENRKITRENAVELLEEKLAEEYKGKVKSKAFKDTKAGITLNAIITDKKNIAVSEKLIFGIGK